MAVSDYDGLTCGNHKDSKYEMEVRFRVLGDSLVFVSALHFQCSSLMLYQEVWLSVN